MAVDHNSEEGRGIRKCIPLNTIPEPHFEKLCKYLTVEKQAKGYQLFERGDKTDDLIYLLTGEVTLKSNGIKIETIAAGSELAKFALAHQIPRKIGAVANNPISFLRMPPKVMAKLQESRSTTNYNQMLIEPEEDTSVDWMTRLLKSPIFQLIPAANLQKTLMSLKEVDKKAGGVIIEQNTFPGDFYFIIKKGKCALSRKPSENAKDVILGKLSAGDSFGESSLLSDTPRDMTVTALTDVTLLKLDKENFLNLIRNPSLTFINPTTIRQEIDNGALLIDIRSPEKFKEYNINGSINIPYFSIRLAAKTLDQNRKIMVICDNGKLSEAAAFNLIMAKLTVAIVEGGMEKARPKEQRYKASFVIDEQDPSEIQQLGDEPITEQDLDAETEQEILDSEPISATSIEEPTVDDEIIEYEVLSPNIEEQQQPMNLAIEKSSPKIEDRLLLEAKIQILRDENRELMKANLQLENQYNELLQQKDMLEKKLKELPKGHSE